MPKIIEDKKLKYLTHFQTCITILSMEYFFKIDKSRLDS